MNDLTVGKPLDLLVRSYLPLALNSVTQQLYSTADSIIVRKMANADGLAAVGAAYLLCFFHCRSHRGFHGLLRGHLPPVLGL